MNEISTIRGGQSETGETEALPHNIEAEQQLLGAILTNNDTYDRVASIIDDSHFFDPVHARIYEIAASRISKNALASPVTLKAFLEDDVGLKELGGPAYLARLAGAAISSFAARDYAQMISDRSGARHLGQGRQGRCRKRTQGADRRGRTAALSAGRGGPFRTRLPVVP